LTRKSIVSAVVNGVEPPEQRDLVTPAVAPVEADFADDHRQNHFRPERQARRSAGHARWQDRMDGDRD
jgi:hypothetical protein